MKSSEMLRGARPLIESGLEHYICRALEAAFGGDANNLRDHIGSLLQPNISLEGWVARVHGVRRPQQPHYFKASRQYRERMRITRLAWIDHMVAEFEAKGD